MCKSFPGSFLKKNLLTEFMYDIYYIKNIIIGLMLQISSLI